MTGSAVADVAIAIAAGLLLTWLALVIVLLIARPRGGLLREALRVLPDVLRLVRRLAADKTLPRGVRVRLWLLLFYLAVPIDLIPDFIPAIGYADDAIIVIAVLRGVVRRAGLDAVRVHWPGTDDGFAALTWLTGLASRSEPRVELLLAPDCPNAAAAKAVVAEALCELDLTVPVMERIGDFPSPTVLVDGIDVMNDHKGAPDMRACRLDVPTAQKVIDAVRRSHAR